MSRTSLTCVRFRTGYVWPWRHRVTYAERLWHVVGFRTGYVWLWRHIVTCPELLWHVSAVSDWLRVAVTSQSDVCRTFITRCRVSDWHSAAVTSHSDVCRTSLRVSDKFWTIPLFALSIAIPTQFSNQYLKYRTRYIISSTLIQVFLLMINYRVGSVTRFRAPPIGLRGRYWSWTPKCFTDLSRL